MSSRKIYKSVTAIAAAVLLLTSCGGDTEPLADSQRDDRKGDEQAAPRSKKPRPTSKPERSKDSGAQKSKSTRRRSSEQATSAGSSAAGTAPGGDAGGTGGRARAKARSSSQAASPVAPGTYSYDTRGKRRLSGGAAQQFPDVTTLQARGSEGDTQYSRRDLRDSQGNGTVTETILVYGEDGVRLSFLKITSHFGSGLTDVREFRPKRSVMLAPTGAGPGDVVRFTLNGSGTKVRVTVRVQRPETLRIAGEAVDTQVVSIDAVFSGALEGDQKTIAWIDPEHLLTVKEHVTTHVRNGPVEVDSEYEAVLRSLSPR